MAQMDRDWDKTKSGGKDKPGYVQDATVPSVDWLQREIAFRSLRRRCCWPSGCRCCSCCGKSGVACLRTQRPTNTAAARTALE
jgi:hypothetical protein